jgi:hypothetical protein
LDTVADETERAPERLAAVERGGSQFLERCSARTVARGQHAAVRLHEAADGRVVSLQRRRRRPRHARYDADHKVETGHSDAAEPFAGRTVAAEGSTGP